MSGAAGAATLRFVDLHDRSEARRPCRMAAARGGLGEARRDDVEVRHRRARQPECVIGRITGRIGGGPVRGRRSLRLRLREDARPADLLHEHRVGAHQVAVEVVRVAVGDQRLSEAADPQLQEIAERPRRPVQPEVRRAAALVADDRLDPAAPDRMLRREDRRRERHGPPVTVRRLREVEAPRPGNGIRAAVRALLRAAGRIDGGRRAVPGDVDAPVVTGGRPGEHVVRETRRRDLNRLRPCRPLVRRVRVHQRGVAGDGRAA